MTDPIKIIQVTDSHLFADKQRDLLGVNTYDSFTQTLELIRNKNKKNIDFIIHTGDLTQDGREIGYTLIAKLLDSFGIPVYSVPGNHDNAAVMTRVYPCGNMRIDNHLLLPTWQIILLNSQIPEKVQGYLDSSQLSLMQSCLDQNPNLHTMIMFHHQPTPVGSKWLDALGVRNANEFWKIVANYSNIKLVVFGHVHQEFAKTINGIPCYATPSTCIQFMRNQDYFGLENLPPGYRWLYLFADGHFETGVERLPHYVGYFDDRATGY